MSFWPLLFLSALLSLGTRLYQLSEPQHVCWDETHFGKFASLYINRTFFFDVHPPLGKMILALSGILTGYYGSFAFKEPGDPYGDTEYLGMRFVCACFGSAVPLLVFGTVYQLTHSTQAAFLSALLLIFDTGTLTLSQYILLDPILLFVIAATFFCYAHFRFSEKKAFTLRWWMQLCLVGLCLALSTGVKFVGLFMVAFVGWSTAVEMWALLGDLQTSLTVLLQHLIARALCLIALPLCVYLSIYAVHFAILTHSGTGDGFFSSAFQSQLQGNPLHNATYPEDVAFGSVVTIKSNRPGGAYLHSHWHLYPEETGPRQQQVTGYAHKDKNNRWLIKRHDDTTSSVDSITFVAHGDLIRLEHVLTRRNLHSHMYPAPVTRRHQQVSCYGENGTGDVNDVFRVEMHNVGESTTLKAVTSLFRLVHMTSGCALYSDSVQLPKWGWEQLEVSCSPHRKDTRTLWNIEEVFDTRLPNVSFTVYAPSFLSKVIESHAVMFQSNAGLAPKEMEVTSQPWQWPVNYRGQPFSGGDVRIYLLGNPVIFWGNLVMMAVYIMLYWHNAFLDKRGLYKQSFKPSQGHVSISQGHAIEACNWLFVGWLCHYVPFWFMGRVLYFHHYFPAFLFSCMVTGIVTVLLVEKVSCLVVCSKNQKVFQYFIFSVLHSGIIYSFYIFSPLAYGMGEDSSAHPESVMHGLKWMATWDI